MIVKKRPPIDLKINAQRCTEEQWQAFMQQKPPQLHGQFNCAGKYVLNKNASSSTTL